MKRPAPGRIVREVDPRGIAMPLDPRSVRDLINAALDLPTASDRAAFLDRECGEDQALRARVEEILAVHDRAEIESPWPATEARTPGGAEAPDATAEVGANIDRDDVSDTDATTDQSDRTRTYHPAAAPPLADSLIAGRYRLGREIGEGGMGTVFLAEQVHPVKRQVALKLIRPGMDSRTVLARFESERQALALMDHPNIAKVLDAGTTENGRPFFVMELVRGVPLTEYCDRHRLALPGRLELFRQICSAVQHAHQKGIIHRDLKPSNILVETHDDRPVPKVIDFGLAKATSGLQLSDQGDLSGFGAVVGTPLYMAPEQAEFHPIDVDTRADIYALGVILYELLTGSTPIRRETFQRAALTEILRVVREDEPPTPSSRISTSDALPSIAANRHIEPARLSRALRGDLDWIVMKALAKERHRRYESAIALAQDIERFENDEPVTAGPPSAVYRFRKFVKRNRGRVLVASLAIVALVGTAVGTTLGLIEARRQRRIAVAQEKETKKRLAQRDKANDLLLSIFRDLDPKAEEKEGKPVAAILGERLDRATSEIEGDATDDPLGVARMQFSLGMAQLGLGHPQRTIDVVTKARATFIERLGPDSIEVASCQNDLAMAYQDLGKLDQALPLFKEALEIRQKKLGGEDVATLRSEGHLANAYRDAGKLDLALPLMEQTFAKRKARLGVDDPDTLRAMNNLGLIYSDVGKHDKALPMLEEALSRRRAKLGRDHLETIGSLNNLAEELRETNKPERAVPLMEEAVAGMRKKLGADHPDTRKAMGNLAACYLSTGAKEKALPLMQEVLAENRREFGPDHPDVLQGVNNLAEAYRNSGKPERAVVILEEALPLAKSKLGADHQGTLTMLNNLAAALLSARRIDEAAARFEELIEISRATAGADHPRTLISINNLGNALYQAKKYDAAAERFEEVLKGMKAKFGAGHAMTLPVLSNLADNYAEAGQLDRALPAAIELAEGWKREAGPKSSQYESALRGLAYIHIERSDWAAAEAPLRELLQILQKNEPASRNTAFTKTMLGGVLIARKKNVEGLPLLRSGSKSLEASTEVPPAALQPRLARVLDRLIAMADGLGKADEAKAWKVERAKLTAAPAPTPGPK